MNKLFSPPLLFILLVASPIALAQSKPNWGRDYVYGSGGRLTVTVEPDTYPPSTPTGFSYTFDTPNCLLNLSWNAASDIGSGVSKYNIYKDNVLFDSVAQTNDSLPQGVHSSVHTYALTAVDVAGNESGRATKSISWPGCTSSPIRSQTPKSPGGFLRDANEVVVAAPNAKLLLLKSGVPAGNAELFLSRLRWLQKTGELKLIAAQVRTFSGDWR